MDCDIPRRLGGEKRHTLIEGVETFPYQRDFKALRRSLKGDGPVRTLGPEGGEIVTSHDGWGEERYTLIKGVETFSYQRNLKAEKPERKTQPRNNNGESSIFRSRKKTRSTEYHF